jgi:signal transduction histidine kinase
VTAEQTPGIALLCEPDGTVREIVRDGLGIAGRIQPGRLLVDMVDKACVEKAEAFLDTLRRQLAAFNWEINVPVGDGRPTPLHFAGGATQDGFLIVGARSRSGVARFYEELIRINNEQTNALRTALKDLSLQARTQADRDNQYFDELSHLNNELATAQRELAKKNAELARLNEQKNQFLGIAAHDLRNPLEVILTYSRFLLDEAAERLDPEHVEFVRTIGLSSDFMLNLVNDLLDLAKIEAGRLDLDLSRVDINELVARNVAMNGVLAERKGTEIVFHSEGEMPLLSLDATKIEQVLNNLIGNAVKFSPPRSHVEVRVAHEGDRVMISIRDQGEGVPAEELENLFKPFERTRVRSTGGEKSTGLGLAIVKRIVTGHGGDISVESRPGQGATFRVALPLG